eukprot:NODE_871_length_3383_cov_0.938794.p1 type:complete len:392 gc:universal NODE_871_length_3383_cov_0.938794:2419-1244(-)
MSSEFIDISQRQSQAVSFASGSDTPKSAHPVSIFTSNSNINIFERAKLSGVTGLSDSKFRIMLYSIVGGHKFNNFMLFVVLVNTLNMILQSSKPFANDYRYYLSIFDSICLGLYLTELCVKILVFHLQYFRNGWNVFDFVIVILSVVSVVVPMFAESATSAKGNLKVLTAFKVFKVLRAIRALRVLRTISFLKSLQIIVATLLKSIPALSSIVELALLVLIVFAVVAKTLYGDVDPDNFGTIPDCIFSLFACISLDQWTDLWQNNEEKAPSIGYFLSLFVFIENFVILNVFVAVLVSNLESSRKRIKKEVNGSKNEAQHVDESEIISNSSDSSTSSSLKFTTIEEYHPDMSIKNKQLELYKSIYEQLNFLDENSYLMDQQNRLLNLLLVKN